MKKRDPWEARAEWEKTPYDHALKIDGELVARVLGVWKEQIGGYVWVAQAGGQEEEHLLLHLAKRDAFERAKAMIKGRGTTLRRSGSW